MTRLAIGAVLALGLVLRLKDIVTNPPELFEDEISGAMSAWSVVTTGHDVIADHLPFFTTVLGPQLPVYGLLTVPFQAVLGHTVPAVRLPAVLLGMLVIVLLYAFVRALATPALALVAAAVVAVLPWAVHFSRIGWDNAAYPPLLLGGLLLLERATRSDRASGRWLAGAALVLGLTAYTYQIAIVMTPLFAAPLLWLRRAELLRLRRRQVIGSALIALAVTLPYVLVWSSVPAFQARADLIGTFATGVDRGTLDRFVTNYLANLSPTFLFVTGDENLRHGTGRGELLLWMLPFAVVGVTSAISRARRSALAAVAIAWLMLAPIPAAITDDGVPHAARSMLELLAWSILVAIGIEIVRTHLARGSAATRWAAAAIFVVAAAAETVDYYGDVFTDYPIRSASAWGSGTAATLREVALHTGPGATACIGTLSRFTFPHVVRWYLGDRPPFTVIEGSPERCAAPGDVVVLSPGERASRSHIVAAAFDVAGLPVATIWQRDAR
ncbi:MAG: hypothetical protein QOH08_477 [Chloroflexota bacterium]|nr:hypothetical protein [Chloroflexota bacterium]